MHRRRATPAGTSREAVLQALRTAGAPASLETIAQAVDLSVNTVRFHLDRLGRDGWVTAVRGRPDGPGRPRRLYRAVAAEAVEGAAAYQLLAGLLAAQLARQGDPTAAVAAGRAWADRLEVASPRPARAPDEPAAANATRRVVELFQDGGFASTVDPDSGEILLHECPFLTLAVERPEVVCAVHLGLVRGLLVRIDESERAEGRPTHGVDAERVRLRPVLDGTGPCGLTLPGPPDRSCAA